jgi:hypothetical protein
MIDPDGRIEGLSVELSDAGMWRVGVRGWIIERVLGDAFAVNVVGSPRIVLKGEAEPWV